MYCGRVSSAGFHPIPAFCVIPKWSPLGLSVRNSAVNGKRRSDRVHECVSLGMLGFRCRRARRRESGLVRRCERLIVCELWLTFVDLPLLSGALFPRWVVVGYDLCEKYRYQRGCRLTWLVPLLRYPCYILSLCLTRY